MLCVMVKLERDRGETPRVDPACADCPGFLVPGAAGAPAPEFHPGASDCASKTSICFMAPSSTFLNLNLVAPARLPPVPKQDAQHKFLQHKGAHAEERRGAECTKIAHRHSLQNSPDRGRSRKLRFSKFLGSELKII